MRIVVFVSIIIIVMTMLSVSCKKESLADYIPFANDTINNTNGLLEDYGDPYNTQVDANYFSNKNWMITVVSEASPDMLYYMDYINFSSRVYDPSNPNNKYYISFYYNDPNKSSHVYALNEMDFAISNGDKKLTGRWFKYGNSSKLILARNKVTLIFTRR